MSDRERWIVYPLLFMALAVGLRDKLTHTVRADRIECRTLVFSDEQQQPRLALMPEPHPRGDSAQRGLLLLDADGRQIAALGPVVQCESLVAQEIATEQLVARKGVQSPMLIATDRNHRPLVAIGGDLELPAKPTGRQGPIKMFDAQGRLVAQLGPVIVCRELHVLDAAGRSRVSLGTTPVESGEASSAAGRITVRNAAGQQAVGIGTDPAGEHGAVTTHGADRAPLVVIGANQWGGLLRVFDRRQSLVLDLGHFGAGRLSGMIAEWADGRVTNLVNSLTTRPEPPDADPQLGPGPPEP